MTPLAFMPQHDAEVGFAVLGGSLVVSGVAAIRYQERGRLQAGFTAVLGVGLVVVALTVLEGESASHPAHYGWGGASGIVFTVVWSILIAVFACGVALALRSASTGQPLAGGKVPTTNRWQLNRAPRASRPHHRAISNAS